MEPPLDQQPSSQDEDAQEKNMIDWSEVVPPAVSPARFGHACTREMAFVPSSRPRVSRARTTTWNVDCAGCRAAGSSSAARWPLRAWVVGAGWSRGAT